MRQEREQEVRKGRPDHPTDGTEVQRPQIFASRAFCCRIIEKSPVRHTGVTKVCEGRSRRALTVSVTEEEPPWPSRAAPPSYPLYGGTRVGLAAREPRVVALPFLGDIEFLGLGHLVVSIYRAPTFLEHGFDEQGQKGFIGSMDSCKVF